MPIGRHRGMPGAQVIPDGWAAAHQVVVAETFDCTITIGAAGEPQWVPERRQMETQASAPVYAGPASVSLAGSSSVSAGTQVEVDDDLVAKRLYTVKISPTATGADDVEVEHLIQVTAAPNPALVGTLLVVTGVGEPGREFSRVLTATLFT